MVVTRMVPSTLHFKIQSCQQVLLFEGRIIYITGNAYMLSLGMSTCDKGKIERLETKKLKIYWFRETRALTIQDILLSCEKHVENINQLVKNMTISPAILNNDI